MPPTVPKIDPTKDQVRFIIDDGTGEEKVAAQFIPANASDRNPPPFTIELKGQASVVQKAVLEGDLDTGHLIWGERDVNRWRRHNPSQPGRVCQLWKLALSEDYRDTPTGRAVFKAIGADHGNMETYEEFTTMRFKMLYNQIIDRLASHHSRLANLEPGAAAREYWTNQVQMETLLMVPAKGSQEAQSIMIAAATDAGFRNVGTVYESLVGVASEIYRLKQSNHLSDDEVMLLLDIGRGTVDISSAIIEKSTHLLKLAGVCSTCDTDGGQVVNDQACDWAETCPDVLKHGKDIDQVCQRMGLSRENFRMLVSDEVERHKAQFPNEQDFRLTIRAPAGWDKIPNGLRSIEIDVTWEQMKEFFDCQVERIAKLLDKHLRQHGDEKIHLAIATGGGAKNTYVREKLDEYFHERIGTICLGSRHTDPTCFGGLQHYPENHAQSFPAGVLYVSRAEEWNSNIHPDAPSGSDKIKRPLVKVNGRKKRKREQWVEDRLTTIMSKKDGQLPAGKRVVMVFYVPVSQPGRIKFPLYYSANASKEHEAVHDDNGNIQSDLIKWTVRFANLTGDFSKHRFPKTDIDGRRHHVLTTIITVQGDETHLDLVLKVLKPDDLQFDDDGHALVDIAYEPLIEKRMEVWDRYRSHLAVKDEPLPEDKILVSEKRQHSTEIKTSPNTTPQPRSESEPRLGQQSDLAIELENSANDRPRRQNQQRADSGISLSDGDAESSLFVSEAGSDDSDSDYQDRLLPVRSATSRNPRKRKRARQSAIEAEQNQSQNANDTSEDELSITVTPKLPRRRSIQAKRLRTTTYKRPFVESTDEDDSEDSFPTPIKRDRPTTPEPRAGNGMRLLMNDQEIDEVFDSFLGKFEEPEERVWPRGR